jgi:hypothetical protein
MPAKAVEDRITLMSLRYKTIQHQVTGWQMNWERFGFGLI